MTKFTQALLIAVATCVSGSIAAAATLDTVKQRGSLSCGGNGQLPGFGLPDTQGNWTGLDVDFCRAIAAAIFNDPTKVKFVALTARDRFTALQTGDVRRAGAQYHMDDLARHPARPQCNRHQLL